MILHKGFSSHVKSSQIAVWLQWAHTQGIEMRVLSDCNSVFINHMLTGAKVNTRVKEVITNLSSFVRNQHAAGDDLSSTQPSDAESSSETPDMAQASSRDESAADGTWELTKGKLANGKAAASHRMVIQPRHDWTVSSHGCPICPANLCKVRVVLPHPAYVLGLTGTATDRWIDRQILGLYDTFTSATAAPPQPI